MDETNNFALVLKPSSAVEIIRSRRNRILAAMVSDVLAVAHVDSDALVRKGKSLYNADEWKEENWQAIELFHRAAEAGHGEAQYLVYMCSHHLHRVLETFDGRGLEINKTVPIEWLRKSAQSGFAEAQRRLADFYQGTHDYMTAVKWYEKAADQGDAPAQCSLGSCYYDGEGVRQDYAEAVKWVRKAAEQGDIIAQKNLGVFYDKGHGVEQNNIEAAKWYRKAAERGNTGAQNDLGVCYETGQGVLHDYEQAVFWYRKAATQGHKFAQKNLGALYANGRVTIEDAIDAYQWIKIAEEFGCEGATLTADMIKNVFTSPEEFQEAERRYKELRSKNKSGK